MVTLAVRVIHLRPARDTRFHQMSKMIKWDCLLIPFGALTPLRAWTNQADVSFERVPKLRQLIESKFPQQTSHSRDTTIVFSCVNVVVRFIGGSHCSKFEQNEPSSITADPFLPEKHWIAVLDPDEQSDKHKDRSANDQRYEGGNDIEKPLEIMIGRSTSQLKTTLKRPKRIDYTQRQITPFSFIEGFQRINARLLKLRVYQALQQFCAERTRFRSENDPAITFTEIV